MQLLVLLFYFGQQAVRIIDQNGEPWWIAKDVCECLEIANHRDALSRLDEDDVGSTDVTDALGRPQETSIINEPGLYNLILGSRKPEAKAFKRWVTHEVLPSIRKQGSYTHDQQATQQARINAEDCELIARRTAELIHAAAPPAPPPAVPLSHDNEGTLRFIVEWAKRNPDHFAVLEHTSGEAWDDKLLPRTKSEPWGLWGRDSLFIACQHLERYLTEWNIDHEYVYLGFRKQGWLREPKPYKFTIAPKRKPVRCFVILYAPMRERGLLDVAV